MSERGAAKPVVQPGNTALENRLVAKRTSHSPPVELPRFARRAIELGRAVHDLQAEGLRGLVTIVIPNRDFFACFVAIGAIEAALTRTSPVEMTLEPGTVVRFLFEGKYLTGTYMGQEVYTVLGERRAYDNVRVGKTGTVRVPSGTASIVPATRKSAKPGRGFGLQALPDWLTFPNSAFGPKVLSAMLSHTELVATVIGTKSALERELREEEFTTVQHPSERWSLDRLVLPQAVEPVNQLIEVVAASGASAQSKLARTVILDGVNAIVRWGACPGPGAHVALLEPTSPALSDASMTLAGVLRFARRGGSWTGRISAALEGLEWSAHEL